MNDYQRKSFSTIVIGGFTDNYVGLSTVEILHDGDGMWQSGPSLPHPVSSSSSVTDPFGSVFLIGGEFGNIRLTKIYRLRNAKSTQWELFPYSLKTGRNWLVSFSVPDWVSKCQ